MTFENQGGRRVRSRRCVNSTEAGFPNKEQFTENNVQFVPSPEGNMPSNLCLDSDSMPNDFQFLEDTDLNFDPQYDFPCLKLPSYAVFGRSGVPWVSHTFHPSSTHLKRPIADLRIKSGLSSMIICSQVRDFGHLSRSAANIPVQSLPTKTAVDPGHQNTATYIEDLPMLRQAEFQFSVCSRNIRSTNTV